MTEQLKALAEAAKGWKFDHIQQCDDEPIEVGQMSDGEFYQIATIDCEQYGESSRPLAEYLVQASPERILALIAENERLAHSRKDAEPVAKLTFEAAWAEMEKRGYRYGRDALAGVKFGWKLHEDWNTAHPPEADKLLQQALEAFQVSTTHFAKDRQEVLSAITAIRTYLEGKK